MNSLVPLDRCYNCGAYRYLMARTEAKGYSVVYLHVLKRRNNGKVEEQRVTKVLAYIPFSLFVHLGATNTGSRGGDTLKMSPTQTKGAF